MMLVITEAHRAHELELGMACERDEFREDIYDISCSLQWLCILKHQRHSP